jgi:methionine-S-sulfoxide reductase
VLCCFCVCRCSCFWGLELAFQRVPGVVKTTVGYSGGKTANPTYDEVCMGFTGHTEVVQCTYDPDQVRLGAGQLYSKHVM